MEAAHDHVAGAIGGVGTVAAVDIHARVGHYPPDPVVRAADGIIVTFWGQESSASDIFLTPESPMRSADTGPADTGPAGTGPAGTGLRTPDGGRAAGGALPRERRRSTVRCGVTDLPDLSHHGPAWRDRLAANLAHLDRVAVDPEGRRHAAVAVVVTDSDDLRHGSGEAPASPEELAAVPDGDGLSGRTAGGPAVLLTRRASALRAHGGQWALPGGRVEPGEDPADAARRELAEELGLALGPEAVIGALDDYATRSGFVITPYVLWGPSDPVVVANPAEVRSVHRVSFRELCRADSPRFVQIPESDRPVVQVPVGDDLIHAPTGAVLLQFRWVAIEGGTGRVADLEQPVFAWR